MTTRGTCNDALTAQCVSDLTQQATNLTAQLAGEDFSCQRLAESLHTDLPRSCKVVEGSWGDVEARNISGSAMSAFTSTKACDPTINSTYSATQVFTRNGTKEELFTAITPILTTIVSAGGSENFDTEVHLNCLKLIDDSPSSDSGFQGGSSRLQWSKLAGWIWVTCSVAVLLSMV